MPKVSFILPAYKRRFLREAIASILAQTYRDFELVVVDDCSPQNLKEVVDEFHDERLSYHRNEVNIGGKDLIAAWNHAMTFAHGEWCVLASDDDVWLPGCLDRLMGLVEKYPKCDLFHARCAYIDGNGAWTNVAPGRLEFESQVQFAYARGALRSPQQAPDFMFRTASLQKIGGFVPFPLAWHSDDATWMVLAKNGCAHTADVSMCFRTSGINLSSSNDSHAIRKIEAGILFCAWAHDFFSSLSPASEEESYLLQILPSRTADAVDGLIAYVFSEIRSSRVFFAALRITGLSRHVQLLALARRYMIVRLWQRVRRGLSK